jgi:beta-glucanase (GH16 family)
MSARLRTVNSFSFTYGRVEVKAQIPKGDWIWPAIWLLPTDQHYGTWPASGEIDIMESWGNAPGCATGSNDQFMSTLHWGPSWLENKHDLTHASYTHTESLGDAFHIYGLLWTPDRIMTYIDSEENVVLDVDTSSQSFWDKGAFNPNLDNPWVNDEPNAPFNRDFHLILNVAVGSTMYFADDSCGKTWSNWDPKAMNTFFDTNDAWYPTWNYPATNQAAMKIDSVNVWSVDQTEVFL